MPVISAETHKKVQYALGMSTATKGYNDASRRALIAVDDDVLNHLTEYEDPGLSAP